MKPLIASVSLVVGLMIGFYIGNRYHERGITNQAVRQMMATMESSDAEHAAEACRVIESVESGDKSNAVRILSEPIANYYKWYAVHADTDRERELRAFIEKLASTNQVVANAIHSTN
jgi:enoyl-CoA hydratase/carnithine racemase